MHRRTGIPYIALSFRIDRIKCQDDFPEPLSPVSTTNFVSRISTSIFFQIMLICSSDFDIFFGAFLMLAIYLLYISSCHNFSLCHGQTDHCTASKYLAFIFYANVFSASINLSRSSAAASKFSSAAAFFICFSRSLQSASPQALLAHGFRIFSSIPSAFFFAATFLEILIRSRTDFWIVCWRNAMFLIIFLLNLLRRGSSHQSHSHGICDLSAYMMTCPSTHYVLHVRSSESVMFLERRNPSLSASRIATSVISGISRPSRRRLIPTSTSNTSRRISRMISALPAYQYPNADSSHEYPKLFI